MHIETTNAAVLTEEFRRSPFRMLDTKQLPFDNQLLLNRMFGLARQRAMPREGDRRAYDVTGSTSTLYDLSFYDSKDREHPVTYGLFYKPKDIGRRKLLSRRSTQSTEGDVMYLINFLRRTALRTRRIPGNSFTNTVVEFASKIDDLSNIVLYYDSEVEFVLPSGLHVRGLAFQPIAIALNESKELVPSDFMHGNVYPIVASR